MLIGKPPSDTSDESVSSFGESEDDTLEDADIGLNSPELPASELPEEEGGSNEGCMCVFICVCMYLCVCIYVCLQ